MSQTYPFPNPHTRRPEVASHTVNRSFWTGRSEFIMVAIIFVFATILLYGSLTMTVMGTSNPGPDAMPLVLSIILYCVGIAYLIQVIRHPEIQEDDIVRPHNFSPDMLYDLAGMEEREDTYRFPPEEFYADNPDSSRLHASEAASANKTPTGSLPAVGEAMTLEEAETSPRRIAVSSDHRSLLATIASAFGFVLVLPYAGWVLSATALFWLIAKLLGSRRPIFDLAIALIVASVIQLVFSGLLSLNLPAGIFGGI